MIETKEQYEDLYTFVPKERHTRRAFAEALETIEALREVARAADGAAHSDVVDWGLQLKLLGRKVKDLPDWITEE